MKTLLYKLFAKLKMREKVRKAELFTSAPRANNENGIVTLLKNSPAGTRRHVEAEVHWTFELFGMFGHVSSLVPRVANDISKPRRRELVVRKTLQFQYVISMCKTHLQAITRSVNRRKKLCSTHFFTHFQFCEKFVQ